MAPERLDALELVRKHLEADSGDLSREMLTAMAQKLMDAEVNAICGADYGTRPAERVNRRNGYRERDWDTRLGTVPLEIPKLRQGTYFPSWLLEPRKRAERALVAVIAEAYVLGISTRRVDALVKSMGLEGMGKSQVSELAQELNGVVEAFRNRPLDGSPYPYIY